jgi:hypothetical protein
MLSADPLVPFFSLVISQRRINLYALIEASRGFGTQRKSLTHTSISAAHLQDELPIESDMDLTCFKLREDKVLVKFMPKRRAARKQMSTSSSCSESGASVPSDASIDDTSVLKPWGGSASRKASAVGKGGAPSGKGGSSSSGMAALLSRAAAHQAAEAGGKLEDEDMILAEAKKWRLEREAKQKAAQPGAKKSPKAGKARKGLKVGKGLKAGRAKKIRQNTQNKSEKKVKAKEEVPVKADKKDEKAGKKNKKAVKEDKEADKTDKKEAVEKAKVITQKRSTKAKVGFKRSGRKGGGTVAEHARPGGPSCTVFGGALADTSHVLT